MTAAALPRPQPPNSDQLQRCLLLAVLLHVWLVLVFGNATGTAAPGQGVWGSLTVKLLGRSGDTTGAPPSQAAPGETPQPREAGATRTGRWNPREVKPEAARSDETTPAPPSTATLELPEGFRPIEREKLDVPSSSRIAPTESPVLPLTPAEALRPSPATPLQAPAAELPPTVGRLETRPEASPARLPSPAELRPRSSPAEPVALPTTELPAPVRRLEAAPQGSTTPLPRPAELRMASPAAPTAAPTAEVPAPVRRLEATPETRVAAPLPQPTELRAPASPAAATSLPSAELPSTVHRLEAPAAEAATSSTLPRAAELRQPAATAPAAAAPTARDLPAPVQRLEATEGAAASVTPLQRATDTRTAPSPATTNALPELSTALPGQVSAPAGPAQGNPAADTLAAPKASPGSPEAGTSLGPNLATPPTAAASAPRSPLNLSLPRGDVASRRGPGLVELLPQPPERKSKLEQSLEDAANKDCRKAYAGAGILAAVPLAIDAVRGKGCKW